MAKRRRTILALKSISLLAVIAVVAGIVMMSTGSRKLLSVQSGSMAPAIDKGDLVSVKRVPLNQLREGDVITFVSPDGKSTTTHRIVTLLPDDPAGNNVITKGDANLQVDAPIEASSVVGKVQRHVPNAGHALDFMYSWPGLILLIYIPALTIIISETRRLAAHYRRQHYRLPGWLSRQGTSPLTPARPLVALIAVGTVLTVAVPAQAALQQAAHLTGNTISAANIPEPPPEPEPKPIVEGGVSLRRVFIACGEGSSAATSVHIILYNSSRIDAEVGGWKVTSGDKTVFTLPPDSVVVANSTFDAKFSLPENISYSAGTLTLQNQDKEHISESVWEPHTRGTRECRTTSNRDDSDEAAVDSRTSTEGRN